MSSNRAPGAGSAVLAACLGAAVVTTGVQGIAPALPATQVALGLSEAEVSLITSAYLLPGAVLGLPAGALAERIGRRAMFCLSLLVFAAGGGLMLLARSFEAVLAVRLLQGVAFGAILALTITIIGDVLTGPAQATGQGRRIMAMTVGEAVFPAAAGLLVGLAWYAPFAMQLLALPVAVWGWFVVPDVRSSAQAPRSHLRRVLGTLHDPGMAGLQVLAFLRFFFKFALITYFPLLAVAERGLSIATVGFALGASSVVGTVTAAVTGLVLRRASAAGLMGASIVVAALTFLLLGLVSDPVVVLTGILVFGAADGFLAVAHNVLVTRAAPDGSRAAFVAMTGTVRNLGKLTAPLICGGLTFFLPLTSAFLVMGVAGAALGLAVLPVSRLEAGLGERSGGPDG